MGGPEKEPSRSPHPGLLGGDPGLPGPCCRSQTLPTMSSEWGPQLRWLVERGRPGACGVLWSFGSTSSRISLLPWAGWLRRCPSALRRCPTATTQTTKDARIPEGLFDPPMSRWGWLESRGSRGWGSYDESLGRGDRGPKAQLTFLHRACREYHVRWATQTTSIGMCDIDILIRVRPKPASVGGGGPGEVGRVPGMGLCPDRSLFLPFSWPHCVHIVTGGNTLLQGFTDRLNRELLPRRPTGRSPPRPGAPGPAPQHSSPSSFPHCLDSGHCAGLLPRHGLTTPSPVPSYFPEPGGLLPPSPSFFPEHEA